MRSMRQLSFPFSFIIFCISTLGLINGAIRPGYAVAIMLLSFAYMSSPKWKNES
jgi:hypothetical protein